MRELNLNFVLSSFRAIVTGKAGLLSILLTLLVLASLESHAEGSKKFDDVSLRELNQQSKQTWNQVLQAYGHNKSTAVLAMQNKKTLPPQIRALAQNVRQYLATSQAEYVDLRTQAQRIHMNDILGESLHPLLRHLLITSIFMDSLDIVNETKPGVFTSTPHRFILIDLYTESFQSIWPVSNSPNKNNSSSWQSLQARVRMSVLGGLLLLNTNDSSQACTEHLDSIWAANMMQKAWEVGVGPSHLRLFQDSFIIPTADIGKCCLDAEIAAINVNAKKGIFPPNPKNQCNGPRGYTAEQLLDIAHSIFGERP
ncbi:hypothetical protein [Bdellovibrio sp. HCB2-146]|uniref:hypothetical protein n=1 Tax=Bdellovibrio sp. HCB2-146 TaxID=3394362 RepID=UPI0039BD2C7B